SGRARTGSGWAPVVEGFGIERGLVRALVAEVIGVFAVVFAGAEFPDPKNLPLDQVREVLRRDRATRRTARAAARRRARMTPPSLSGHARRAASAPARGIGTVTRRTGRVPALAEMSAPARALPPCENAARIGPRCRRSLRFSCRGSGP